MFLFLGSQLPEGILGYRVFSDDKNFNTGYPKAILESVRANDFSYKEISRESISPTLTGKWAPVWPSNDGGLIRVDIILF